MAEPPLRPEDDTGNAVSSANRVLNALKQNEPEIQEAVRYLSVPHWFDDRVIAALPQDTTWTTREGIQRVRAHGLIETWADGSNAIISPVREAVVEAMVRTDEFTFRQISESFAAAFAQVSRDIYYHIE